MNARGRGWSGVVKMREEGRGYPGGGMHGRGSGDRSTDRGAETMSPLADSDPTTCITEFRDA